MVVTLPLKDPAPLAAIEELAALYRCETYVLPGDSLMMRGEPARVAGLLNELIACGVFALPARGTISEEGR